jgi:uncharacterized membrane protein
MEPKRTKYDTNPLDDDVVAHADSSWGTAQPGSPTSEIGAEATSGFDSAPVETSRRNSESEAPTRRIDEKIATSYPSIFVPSHSAPSTYEAPRVRTEDIYLPPPANIYQARGDIAYKPGSNSVSGLGIPERWAVTLPYLPVFLAMVIAIVELLLVPRTETRVRFHASQALVLHIVVTAVVMLLSFAGVVSGGRFTGASLFNVASSVLFIIAMVRVWKGKPVVVAPADEPRKWLDEKIKPRK